VPVRGLEDIIRVPRQFNIRLGQRVVKLQGGGTRTLKVDENGGYPTETEWFVMTEEVPKEIREVYGTEPRSLRMMLLTEYDQLDERGQEMSLNLNNRAWRQRGLHCFGHGRDADEPDIAYTNDPSWAERIAANAKSAPEKLAGEARKRAPVAGEDVWQVPCLGQDCPKYMRMVEGVKDGKKAMVPAEGHDADASCKANIVLRGFLLNPKFGVKGHPGEREVLAGVQLASGSYNSIVQLRSGFSLMRGFTKGRTMGIPFTLIRKPTTTFTPMRQVHWTLDIVPQPAEWQKFASLPMEETFLTDEIREYRRLLAAQPIGVDWDAVKDLYPGAPRRALTAPQAQAEQVASSASAAKADQPVTEPASTEPEDADRLLTRGEVTELRRLFGPRRDPDGPEDDNLNPFPPEVQAKLVGAIALYNERHGTQVKRFTELTVRVYEFVKKLAQGQPQEDGNAAETLNGSDPGADPAGA